MRSYAENESRAFYKTGARLTTNCYSLKLGTNKSQIETNK